MNKPLQYRFLPIITTFHRILASICVFYARLSNIDMILALMQNNSSKQQLRYQRDKSPCKTAEYYQVIADSLG